MDLLNPTPTLRPSAENVLAETEKGRRTDSPERVNQSIPTVSQPTGTRNAQKIPTRTGNIKIIPIKTRNAQEFPTGSENVQVIQAGAGNSQRIPTQNSVINPTETGNSVINPTGNNQVRSPAGTGNAQQFSKVKNYFRGKKKEVKFSGKCLLPGEKYSSQTEKVKISEKYDSEQTRIREYSV